MRRCFLIASLLLHAAAARAAPCGEATSEGLRVAGVDVRLEITLEDGRRLRLPGVEAPKASAADPARPARSAGQLRAWLMRPGLEARLELLAAAPDRWSRLPARLFAPGGDGAVQSVGEAIIEAGLARVEIDPLARPCLRGLLALEAKARRERLGLWADPAFAVLRAADRDALSLRAGEMLLVEGRVTGVGSAASRSYLNFGPIRTVDFAAVVARANVAVFEKSGLSLQTLEGRFVRLRGLMETQFGPQIELMDPEALELTQGRGD